MKVIRAELLNYVIDSVLRSEAEALFSGLAIIENGSSQLALDGS